MSQKKLRVNAIANELEGASLYFKSPSTLPQSPSIDAEVHPSPPDETASFNGILENDKIPPPASLQAGKYDSTQASKQDSMQASVHDSKLDSLHANEQASVQASKYVSLQEPLKASAHEMVGAGEPNGATVNRGGEQPNSILRILTTRLTGW